MTSADPVAPEPAGGLLAALRVPLFLIALGGLFLAEDYVGWAFGRTWPSLLVLWGVLLMAGRRRNGE